MLFFLIAFILAPFNHVWAMEDNRFINLTEHQLEVAFKTYQFGDKQVQTLATIHFGDKHYFEVLTKGIKDQVVIYELKGCDFSQKTQREKMIDNLEPYYQRLFNNIRRLQACADLAAFRFGLAMQSEELDLSAARVLIHADFIATDDMQKRYESPATLRNFLIAIRDQMGFYSPDDDLSDQVLKKALTFSDLKTVLMDVFGDNEDPSTIFPDFEARHKIVFEKIVQGLQNHNEIVIPYGAWHQPYIAAFLQNLGFKWVKTEWVPVIKLPNSHDAQC